MIIGLGIGIPFIRNYVSSIVFDPSKLFTGSTNGAWYDPSDFSTMFQDAAGTTPVTAVGQPVGLMLDKSKGLVLGPELVTNGTFDTDSGWAKGAGWTISGGAANASAASSDIYQSNVALADTKKAYVVEIVISNYVSGTVRVALLGRNSGFVSGNGKKTFIAAAGGNTDRFLYITGSSFTGSIDNISVRELPGNHAYNPSGNSANFPVLSARVNLLTKTEDFSDAVWVKDGISITPNAVTAPDGSMTADKFVETNIYASHVIYGLLTVVNGATYTYSCYAKKAERKYLRLVGATNFVGSVNFDLDDGSYTVTAGTPIVSVAPAGNGWYRCAITTTATSTSITPNISMALTSTGTGVYQGDGTSGIYIWGADLRPTNTGVNLPPYQRVNTATDYDTVGFKPYLSFNGVNQWLQTNSIDFTGTDKMTVVAGVRKLSDAARGVLTEFSVSTAGNAGSFVLTAPEGATSNYGFGSRGSILNSPVAASPFAAPITHVLTGIGDISGDSAILRVNGAQAAISTADQGTGNYGNYPLYIGARAGSDLWFNGRLYGLVVAGKQVPELSIQLTEKYLNDKTVALDWRDVTDSSSFRWNSATASPDAS